MYTKAFLKMVNLILLLMNITKNFTITTATHINDPININMISMIDHLTGITEEVTNIIGGQILIVIILDNLVTITLGVLGVTGVIDKTQQVIINA